MNRDEHGMPLPYVQSPLPWKKQVGERGGKEAWIITDAIRFPIHESIGVIMEQDADFAAHAANWIIPCREIVRELAECHPSDWDMVATKAKKLWDEMLKGAGDE